MEDTGRPTTGAPRPDVAVTDRPTRATATATAGDRRDRPQRWPWVVPLVAAGAVLGAALPRLRSRPLWLDEAYTLGATSDLVAAWRGSGGTMALYYAVIWPVTQLTDDRFWLRLPSALFAAAAVAVVYEVGRRIGGVRVGALAAGFLAIHATVARYALEARSYSLALLLVSLGWLGLVAAVSATEERDRQRWWTVFVVASLLAPLAHGLAALHVVVQVATVALAPGWRAWLRRCRPMAVALAVELAVLSALGAGEVADWIDPLSWAQVRGLAHPLLGRGLALWLIGGAALVVAVGAIGRARRALDLVGWLGLVPVVWAAGFPVALVVVSAVRPYTVPRYVLGSLPGVALLVAVGLARARSGWVLAAGSLVVAGLLLPAQPRVVTSGIEDWPALVDQIAGGATPGDRLLVPAKLRPPIDDAWSQRDRPALVPLSPTDPLGSVQRFYAPAPGSMRDRLLARPSGPVWYVDRDEARLDDVDALLADPDVRLAYRVTGRWAFTGELYLVRLDPRP